MNILTNTDAFDLMFFALKGKECRWQDRRPRMVCNDGFTMSVQASSTHYCSPRVQDAEIYENFEIGYPSDPEMLIYDYAENEDDLTQTVYAQVPKSVVIDVILKHGGLNIEKTREWTTIE